MKILLLALACIPMSVGTAWGEGSPGRQGPEELPSTCPAMVGLPYDPGLWRGNVEYYRLPLEQVRWFSGVGEATGYVECVAAPDSLGSARATMLGTFSVSRPQSPAWRAEGSWLTCDPGNDPGSCDFSAVVLQSSGKRSHTAVDGGTRTPFGG